MLKKMNSNLCRAFLIISSLLMFDVSYAHNRVVVIPLLGDDVKPLANVVTVAKSNGDFNNPAEALYSIKDASESNPYLVIIAPGVYVIREPLSMKEFVNIAGSGVEVTKIVRQNSGSLPDSAGNIRAEFDLKVVVGANNAAIEDLTITANGSVDDPVYFFYNDGVSPRIERVNIIDDANLAGDRCYGVYNDESSPLIRDVSMRFKHCNLAFGISNKNNSTPLVVDSTIISNVLSEFISVGNGGESENETTSNTGGVSLTVIVGGAVESREIIVVDR